MADNCALEQKRAWEERGTMVCAEVFRLAHWALDTAKEQEAAKTHLKILESGRDKLGNTAKAEDKSEDDALEMNNDVRTGFCG
jgi:hypothetical protein